MSVRKYWYYYNDEDDGGNVGPKDPLNTFSGSIVQFISSQNYPFQGLAVGIAPVQDLHGQSNPWPAGGGKNKLPPPVTSETRTYAGITIVADNGVYTITGKATAASYITFDLENPVDLSPSTNKIAFLNTVSDASLVVYFMRDDTELHYWTMNTTNRVAEGWTDTGNEVVNKLRIKFANGNTYNITVSPMLVSTSVSDYTWEPYENVCPISGWTGGNVTRTGKNILPFKFYSGLSYNNNVGTEFNMAEYSDGTQSGNTITFSDLSGWARRCMIAGPLPVGTYHVKMSVSATSLAYTEYILDSDKKVVRKGDLQNGGTSRSVNKTLTITAGEKYIAIYVGTTSSGYLAYTEPQIEVGDTANDFEPYAGTTLSIDWTDEAGTVYGGTLDVLTGTLTVDKVSVTFAGGDDESWANNNGCFTLYVSGIKQSTSTSSSATIVLCDTYKNGGVLYRGSVTDGMIVKTVGANNQIAIKDTTYENVAAFKAALKITPIQVVYQLATPIEYTVDSETIDTLVGLNNVWSDTGDTTVIVYGTPVDEPDADALMSLNILLGGRYTRAGDDPTDEEALDIILGGNTR